MITHQIAEPGTVEAVAPAPDHRTLSERAKMAGATVRIQLGGNAIGSPIRGYAFVGDEDAELSSRLWHMDAYGYARRHNGENHFILMHREVMSRVVGRPILRTEIVDHIDRNRLNNDRRNLRIVSTQESRQNRGPNRNNPSGCAGVHWSQKDKRWVARVMKNNKHHSGGSHIRLDDAIAAVVELKGRLGFATNAALTAESGTEVEG